MSESSRQPRDHVVWLSLIILAGALLRAWGLPTLPWEEDELYTLRDARDLGATAAAVGGPGIAARPLYYLLQHLLLEVLPVTPLGLRLPAYLFGIAGIWATWWLGRQALGHRAGLVAAALVAVSPWHLYASQFARYWTLVYLMAALTVGALLAATDGNRPRLYVRAACCTLIGMATHPTFLFPLVGAFLTLHMVDRDGKIGLIRPRIEAIRWYWLPVGVVGIGAFVAIKLLARPEALQNDTARGLVASLRLIPAMIQWMGPAVAAAAAAATLLLLVAEPSAGRRWAVLTVLGVGGAFFLLVIASFKAAVYADYGIAGLPLVLATIGGAIHRTAARFSAPVQRWALTAGTLAVVGALVPETLSHLSDGSRFDYRPAFSAIRQLGSDYPVLGRIEPLVAADAPDLKYVELGKAASGGLPSGFWLITSVRRFGLREGGHHLQMYVDLYCRRVRRFERPRLDYRLYRVDLLWCGRDPMPERAAAPPPAGR